MHCNELDYVGRLLFGAEQAKSGGNCGAAEVQAVARLVEGRSTLYFTACRVCGWSFPPGLRPRA